MPHRKGDPLRRITLGLFGLTIWLGCEITSAEGPPPNIGSTVREIEQRRPAVPPQRKPSLEVEGRTRAATEPGDATRFRVTSIRIGGATAFSDLELLPFLDGIAGRAVTLAELEAGAARITQFYRSHGYPVARAYVPAQNVENGAVEIAVLEGRYGKLDVRNHTRLLDSVVRSTLRAPAADNVIETAPLDHDMLLLKDLAGVAVEATLTPGELVGTSDLVVDITAAPTWSGTLEADTFGNDYTGELRFGGSVVAANLAGRGDLLTVRGLISQDSGLWYGRAAYQMALSGGRLRAGAALSHTHYSLGEKFKSLDADGDADVYTAFVQYPLVRSTRTSIDLQAAFNYFDLQDSIDAVDSDNPRSLKSASIGISGGRNDDFFGGGINAASLSFARGDLDLEDDIAASIDDATAQTAGDFDTVMYSVLRLQNLAERLQFYVALQGQYASKNLDSSQKFVLGGPNSVRAYEQGVGVGDQALLGTVELRYWLPARGWLVRDQVFVFFDGGSVHVNEDPYLPTENQIDLYGAGIGVNLETRFGINVRGSVAWEIGSDPAVDSSGSSPRAWVQLVKAL
jgi:hemolysin activation/secretion protein